MTTAAAKASIATIVAKTAGGAQALGSLCWWRLTGRHHQATLLAAFKARGLDEKLVPSALDTERAFRRAVRRAVKTSGNTRLVRPMADDKNEVVLGVVAEHNNVAARDLDYTVVDRVAYDKATGTITGGAANAVTAETRALEAMVEGPDITRMLVRWIESVGGCALRDDGGVYWVPPAAAGELQRIGEAIEEGTNGNCAVYPLPITASGNGEAERGLGASAKAGLEAQISEVAEEIAKFKADPPRASTLERRLEWFDELRNRAGMYRDLLKVSAGDLETKIGEMETAVRDMIAGTNVPKAEKKVTNPIAAGDKVKVKANEAATYAKCGIKDGDVLTVTDNGQVRGTVWVELPAGGTLMIARADLEVA